MIVGIGICMLVVGLIGIVILQMVRKRSLEGFWWDGACSPTCYLDKTKMSVEDYRNWCNKCESCLWNEDTKDCKVDPDYAPPEEEDPTIDTTKDYCKAGCTNITEEGKCNRCPSCISCVNVSDDNPMSDNYCIDRKDYTPERCPGTTDDTTDSPPTDSSTDSRISDICKNSPCDRIEPKDGTCDLCPNCKSCWPEPGTNGGVYCINKNEKCPAGTSTKNRKYYFDKNGNRIYPSTSEEQEEDRRRKERDDIDTADTMDYTAEESEETAKAKEKNKKSKFLRDFQQIVHNELLNEQGMTTANSQEYLKDKASRHRYNMKLNQKRGCPDMSEYVRKDSIPCWGCTLD